MTKQASRQWVARRWLTLTLILVVVVALAALIWPYISFLTDREELQRIVVDSGPWAPLVFMFLQMLQVVIAPLPGTVISLAGGYIFEAVWATLYAMIGTTVGFWIVFVVSKRYGRRVMKYFVPADKIAKYDRIASSKGAFAFISVGFLFPFIPDPVLGYVAGTTPIPTRVLMVISLLMRFPGIAMTSTVGSQFGQGNYTTVVVMLAVLLVVLVLGVIFYKQISAGTDRLYKIAMREQKEDQRFRRQIESVKAERRQRRRRRTKKAVKQISKKVKQRLGDDDA